MCLKDPSQNFPLAWLLSDTRTDQYDTPFLVLIQNLFNYYVEIHKFGMF